jgi:catechol 2,3-dioxygenase-like lactoylglutathione lyase family enzyme
MSSVLAAFVVSDVAAAVAHYRDVLGFRVSPAEVPGVFAIVDLAPGQGVHLRRGEAGAGRDMGVYVRQSLDELAASAARAQAGGPIKHPPKDQAWGMREFAVLDLDGHLVRFGADLDGSHPPGQPQTSPEIPVDDVDAAVAYSRDVLGFQVMSHIPGMFAQVRTGGAILHWYGNLPQEEHRPPAARNRTRGDIWDAYIHTRAVDDLAARLRPQVLRGPETTEYDLRELEVAGPEGCTLCFAEEVQSLRPPRPTSPR